MDPSKLGDAPTMAMLSGAPAGVAEGGQSVFAALAQIVELLQINALDIFGVLTLRMHHPVRRLTIVEGTNPHQ